MLETINDIKPFNHSELKEYLSQFPSVCLIQPGRHRNQFCHIRPNKHSCRDLEGQQMRILLESLGVKVYSRIFRQIDEWNFYFGTDCYVNEIPEGSLPIVFPMFQFPGGATNDAWIAMHDLAASGKPYLWNCNDAVMGPTIYMFTRIHPDIANVKTIGMADTNTFYINFNINSLKESSVEPTIPKICYGAIRNRRDLKKRMRYLTPEYAECFGLSKEMFGFQFGDPVDADQLTDYYSQYYATLYATTFSNVLNNVTPRLYETMCSNAVVFFDVQSDIGDFLSWKFRKVTSKEDAIKKLKYIIDHPDFRQKLVNEQHEYIKKLDDHLNK